MPPKRAVNSDPNAHTLRPGTLIEQPKVYLDPFGGPGQLPGIPGSWVYRRAILANLLVFLCHRPWRAQPGPMTAMGRFGRCRFYEMVMERLAEGTSGLRGFTGQVPPPPNIPTQRHPSPKPLGNSYSTALKFLRATAQRLWGRRLCGGIIASGCRDYYPSSPGGVVGPLP